MAYADTLLPFANKNEEKKAQIKKATHRREWLYNP